MALTKVNLIDLFSNFKALISAGSSIKASASLVNTEATAAALYGLVSAIIQILKALGYEFEVSWVDMHTMTQGWAITASFSYALYRVITNPEAGIKRKSEPSI